MFCVLLVNRGNVSDAVLMLCATANWRRLKREIYMPGFTNVSWQSMNAVCFYGCSHRSVFVFDRKTGYGISRPHEQQLFFHIVVFNLLLHYRLPEASTWGNPLCCNALFLLRLSSSARLLQHELCHIRTECEAQRCSALLFIS